MAFTRGLTRVLEEYEIEVVTATQVVIGSIVMPLDGGAAQLTSGNCVLLTHRISSALNRGRLARHE